MTFRRNLSTVPRISFPPSFFLYNNTERCFILMAKKHDNFSDLILRIMRARLSHTVYVSLISTTHKINDTSIMTLPVFVNHISFELKKKKRKIEMK